jgi:phosphoserine phosphatase RsbU/P
MSDEPVAALGAKPSRRSKAGESSRAKRAQGGRMTISPSSLPRREEQLRDLQAVTEGALGHLEVNELLRTLLDRIKRIVEADTTTVLLLDPETHVLVARSSLGLEEEVRLRVEIPVGVGFAGRIAAERRPIMIDRVDASTVTNPILWEHGVKVLLGVPLLSGGEIVGVLHVGRCKHLPFNAEEAEILSVAAERMASAIQAEKHRQIQVVADFLVDDLRPGHPPKCPGVEFGTRYLPAEKGGAGGDWYDVFLAHSGQLWMIVGDVAGHGLTAAVIMGRVQTTLRAFCSLDRTPEFALETADRVIQQFDPSVMVTAVCAVMAPPYRELRVATAGHPPPILARSGEETEIAAVASEPPLGVLPDLRRSSRTLPFPDASTALFYTDGLVERRGESLDIGIERLRDNVHAEEAETACSRVLRSLVGRRILQDDVAVLAVHAST